MSAEDKDTAAGTSDLPSPRLVVGRLFSIKMLLDQVVKSGCNDLVQWIWTASSREFNLNI